MEMKKLLKTLATLGSGYAAGRIHQAVKGSRRIGFQYDELTMFRQELLDLLANEATSSDTGPPSYQTIISGAGKVKNVVPADYDEKAMAIAAAIEEVSKDDAEGFLQWAKMSKKSDLINYFYDFMSSNTPAEIVEYFNSLPSDPETGYRKFMKDLGIPGVDEFHEKIDELKKEYPGKHEQLIQLMNVLVNIDGFNPSSEQFEQFMDLFNLLSIEENMNLLDSFDKVHQNDEALAENRLLKVLLQNDTNKMKQYFKDLGWI